MSTPEQPVEVGTFLTGSEVEALDEDGHGRVRVRLTELARRSSASLTLTMNPTVACALVDAVVSALDAHNLIIPAELDRLREQRAAALALHQSDLNTRTDLVECTECIELWPCPTARALGVTE